MTDARVVADSVSQDGSRLTTIEVTMHRFVLAEFNTHRVFSRNSASSRAMSATSVLSRALHDPAQPLVYPSEQPGMSGGDLLQDYDLDDAEDVLYDIQRYTIRRINEYIAEHPDKSTRLHKSILNRPLEWFSWHTVLVSSTEWDNFFAQRCHEAAQPEMRAAAEAMRAALHASEPVRVVGYFWHLPYITDADHDAGLSVADLRRVSVARCARLSTGRQEDGRSHADELAFYDRLLCPPGGGPGHLSPFEHVATPLAGYWPHGNFTGWAQFRHLPAFH